MVLLGFLALRGGRSPSGTALSPNRVAKDGKQRPSSWVGPGGWGRRGWRPHSRDPAPALGRTADRCRSLSIGPADDQFSDDAGGLEGVGDLDVGAIGQRQQWA